MIDLRTIFVDVFCFYSDDALSQQEEYDLIREAKMLSGKRSKKIVYFDMDGVLADYNSSVNYVSAAAQSAYDDVVRGRIPVDYNSMSSYSKKKFLDANPDIREARLKLYAERTNATCVPGFFLNLEPLPWAHRLVLSTQELFGDTLCVLSSPIDIKEQPEVRKNCVQEKQLWLEMHFPGIFRQAIFEKNKSLYAAPNSILIDDRSKNIDPFNSAGGIGVLFDGDFKKTLRQLRKIAT